MPRFFQLLLGDYRHQKGGYSARRKWLLPGVSCPECKATWGGAGLNYPAVDLSGHPVAKTLSKAHLEEDFEEFERLREQVRPLLPSGFPLEPGTTFGPLVGKARGPFSVFTHQYGGTLLVRYDALELLQAEGIRGLRGVPTEMVFRPKGLPELLDLHIEPRGLLHPDCIPRSIPSPCPKCGRQGFSLPKQPILDKDSLPKNLDLFRLRNFATVLVVTERFKKGVERFALDGLTFRELPVQPSSPAGPPTRAAPARKRTTRRSQKKRSVLS
ncbi:SitI6 family double-CXXCG motif immunity protein [Pyxidicoccus xibeiensis]|uniref:SitI6 family double-CXXCG motif immunity protein n=1 Tax=Pyxidicoccus xibeiensis TaxID=2906759 RepID=UPI0020A6F0A6|nr:double-CXXCG motif protein [Pyxidicoccus xibeiensis]MCP3142647.1 double-CXXCG motif protein [Pyxidicoccus xibeiensis]